MKMTIRIDADLLQRVMKDHGFATKTEAVEKALRELDRRARYEEFMENGLGLTPEELADGVYPGYDPKDLSKFDPLGIKVAESSEKYGK